ncbi:MAG: D-ribose pyranase [Candidatus Kryptonium sp.]|nr:D-ribose pyranase [Candidatus Kryptonium sp.]
MKKQGVFNSEISSVISSMGHKDSITIVDLGYPIPSEAKRIDLAVDIDLPSIFDVLENILKELYLEEVIVASEASEGFVEKIKEITNLNSVQKIPHEEFKEVAKSSKAYIRTGAALPYHNVILISGVIF